MTIINDLNNIISKDIIVRDDNIIRNIENYIYNYFESNKIIYHIDYIKQILLSKEFYNTYKINDILVSKLTNIYKENQNEIRIRIYNNTYTLSNLNELLIKNIEKIKSISDIFNILNKQSIQSILYNLLLKYIVFDVSLLEFIKEIIIKLDILIYNKQLENLNILICNIKIMNENYFNQFLYFCSDTLKLKFSNNIIDHNIPKELLVVNNLSTIIKTIKFSQKFLCYGVQITQYLLKYIVTDIINILNSIQSVDDLENISYLSFLLDEMWTDINNIIPIHDINNHYKYVISKNIQNILNIIKNNLLDSNIVIYTIYTIHVIIKLKLLIDNKLDSELIYDKIKSILNTNIITGLHNEININILNKDYVLLKNFIPFVINIQNHIEFKNCYLSLLHKRLSFYINKLDIQSIHFEHHIVYTLLTIIDNKYLYKLNKSICDTKKSIFDNIEFNNRYTNNIITKTNISCMTMTYDIWNIDYLNKSVEISNIDDNYNSCITEYMKEYTTYYINNCIFDIKLLWHLYYGYVKVEFNNYIITMLPIQYIIISLFNANDYYIIEDIYKIKILSTINTSDIHILLDVLVRSNLFYYSKDLTSLHLNNIELNNDINLIDMLYSNITYNQVDPQEHLAFTKIEIICSVINHFIKTQSYKYNKLYDVVINNIKLFTVDTVIFNSSLEYMIKMDYIICKNDTYEKLY